MDYGPANKLDQYPSQSGNLYMAGAEQVTTPPANETTTFTYDANGNLTSDGAGRTYSYNSENQLIHAVSTAAGASFDIDYLYDAQGRRSHTIDNIANTETFHKHWGQMEVGDYAITRGDNDSNNKVTSYTTLTRVVPGASIDMRLAWHDVAGSNRIYFALTNHQGSTIAITDDQGVRLSTAEGGALVYDPYGNEVSGAAVTGYPYRYTGRRLDAQTGLYYYRARFYSPELGRFLQNDPIGTQDQMNLYAYVGNDPMNATDPSGACTKLGSAATFETECPSQQRQVNITVTTGIESAGGVASWKRATGRGGYESRVNVQYAQATTAPRTAPFASKPEGTTTKPKPKPESKPQSKQKPKAGKALQQIILEQSVKTIVTTTSKSHDIPVYRVCDNISAMCATGRSWTPELPHLETWRDRLAVYPAWNEGYFVNVGSVTFYDMFISKTVTGTEHPGSIAGPRPFDMKLGGGPYSGTGVEWLIEDAAVTVRNQTLIPFEIGP